MNRTATGLFDGQGQPLFQFDAYLFSLPQQVVGQKYRLILFSGFNGPSGVVANDFLWAQGGGGNNTEAIGDNYVFQRVDGNRAFELFLLPEPSALVPLFIGLVALAGMVEWRKHRGR